MLLLCPVLITVIPLFICLPANSLQKLEYIQSSTAGIRAHNQCTATQVTLFHAFKALHKRGPLYLCELLIPWHEVQNYHAPVLASLHWLLATTESSIKAKKKIIAPKNL